jgi:hypothetical protein
MALNHVANIRGTSRIGVGKLSIAIASMTNLDLAASALNVETMYLRQ